MQDLLGYKLNGLKPAGTSFRSFGNSRDGILSDSASSSLGTDWDLSQKNWIGQETLFLDQVCAYKTDLIAM